MFQKCLKLRKKQIIQEDPHHSEREKRHPRPVSDDKEKGEKTTAQGPTSALISGIFLVKK